MHRQPLARGVLAIGASFALTAAAAPQGIGGLLRTVDGSPLTDARVWLFPVPVGADIEGLETELPAAPPLSTRSDGHGAFRFDTSSGGLLVVVHANGQGALARVSSRQRGRVVASPGAAVQLMGGGQLLGLATDVAGVRFSLGTTFAHGDGTELRLPAGEFRALVGHRDGSRSEHALALRSGDRVTIFKPTAAPTRVRMPSSATAAVVVDRWFEQPLPVTDQHIAVWPSSHHTTRHLRLCSTGPEGATSFHDAMLIADRLHTTAANETTWQTREVSTDSGIVLTLRTKPRLQLVGTAPVRGGRVSVVADAGEFGYLLLDGKAGLQVRTSEQLRDASAGHQLDIVVNGGTGPLAGAGLSLLAGGLTRNTTTDAAGRAGFALVPRADAELRLVSADSWLPPVILDAATIAAGRVELTAKPGATIHGQLQIAGPRLDLRRVSLTLRDPTGVLGIADRRIEVDAAGKFVAGGLPPDARFTLYASLTAGVVTYSAKLHGVLSGSEVALELRSEDVPLPGGR